MNSIVSYPKIMEKCQIFTPGDQVKLMLDLADYTGQLFGKTVLENSCGNGQILAEIVYRYIKSCKNNNLSDNQIIEGLERDITAYEIDRKCINQCIERLNSIVQKFSLTTMVKWDIRCEDFLLSQDKAKFDYIIGNPPYISYPDLPLDTKNFIKGQFKTCKEGKFDYCYAFIEKSYSCMKSLGVLVYLVPSNIFKKVYAQNIRNFIKDDIETIIDYPEQQIFDGVLISPAIIVVRNEAHLKHIVYSAGNRQYDILKSELGDKWDFSGMTGMKGKLSVGVHYKVSSCVATLCNEAFIFKSEHMDDNYYYVDGKKIEKGIVKKASSPRNLKNATIEYIIFPYDYDSNGELIRFEESQLKEQFPNAYDYLYKFKSKLSARDADKSARWFEYGRSQALRHIHQEKIIISSIISNCTEAYILGEDDIPYSGYYIVPKSNKSLDRLLPHLNSDDFRDYCSRIGVCVNGTSKRITPADIEAYQYDEDE